MRSKKIMAWLYYKQLNPNDVLFFRVKDCYEVYQEDAMNVCKIINVQVKEEVYERELVVTLNLPVNEGFECASLLSEHNLTTKMISQRDENGEYSLPDIDKLKNEKTSDY